MTVAETIHFTGKERDGETGLDYFGARYFSGAQGRFTSPDPLLNSGRPWEPQSWNRYTYALNNPLRSSLVFFGVCPTSVPTFLTASP
jgi:RHS repeat-associated protein